jgi:putative ATP-dependent endonuclease of OLD family
LVENDADQKWKSPNRRWRAARDFGDTPEAQAKGLTTRRNKITADDGQVVRTFAAEHWTLEYDLAHAGLAEEVYLAGVLAKNDDPLNEDKKQRKDVESQATADFAALKKQYGSNHEGLCSEVYKLFKSEGASKAIAAQYLAEGLLARRNGGNLEERYLRRLLPAYLVGAIDYVTPDQNRKETGIGGEL